VGGTPPVALNTKDVDLTKLQLQCIRPTSHTDQAFKANHSFAHTLRFLITLLFSLVYLGEVQPADENLTQLSNFVCYWSPLFRHLLAYFPKKKSEVYEPQCCLSVCHPLITSEPIGRFSSNSAGRSCY
jgi:hypothetical protein